MLLRILRLPIQRMQKLLLLLLLLLLHREAFGVGFVSFKVTVENSKDWDAEEGSEIARRGRGGTRGNHSALEVLAYCIFGHEMIGQASFSPTILYSYIHTFLPFGLSFFCGWFYVADLYSYKAI